MAEYELKKQPEKNVVETSTASVNRIPDKEGVPEITLSFNKTNNYGKITRSEDAATFIKSLYAEGSIELQEHAVILYLNRSNEIVGYYRHSMGGTAETILDVKLILSTALKSLSSSIIIAHNHPSGSTKPSSSDTLIAERIKKAADAITISLLDFLIITKEGHYSFADEGLMGISGYHTTDHSSQQVAEPAKIRHTEKNALPIRPQKIIEVERIEDEIRFIKRYVALHGKVKTNAQILSFINSLQKAILEKRIRKTSTYAKEMGYIQSNLIKLHNVMKDKVEISVNKDILKRFQTISRSKKVRLSVTYLKRYIGIQGRKLTKEKAERLIELLRSAVRKRKVIKNDPYVERLEETFNSLVKFVQKAKPNDRLEIHSSILNGLNEALEGCGCEKTEKGLKGLDGPSENVSLSENRVMNSMDFAKLKFDTIGFTGKWKDFIGDPSKGFTAMVFGKPKMGKSFLCIDFAGYLAREHGNTLYVANEEKLDKTLQDKLNDKNVKHPRLFVSDHIPKDLSQYQFIFLDSVNKLGLEPEALEVLKRDNPGKSFIYIFQSTKEGNFRGANQFQHDVDVVIEVPEKGKAVQFGRFNQGGEIDIFKGSI